MKGGMVAIMAVASTIFDGANSFLRVVKRYTRVVFAITKMNPMKSVVLPVIIISIINKCSTTWSIR